MATHFRPSSGFSESDSEDLAYFEARAEQEMTLARGAGHEAAASAHLRLACAYLDRLDEFGKPVDQPASIGQGRGESAPGRPFLRKRRRLHTDWPARRI